mgnify:CR=1 FL=1|jgi:hypothetical protein
MNNQPDTTLLTLFHESLTPEEQGMLKALQEHLQANALVMPSNEALRGELGISAVFIAKVAFLLEGMQIISAVEIPEGGQQKAVERMLEHRQPVYDCRIAEALQQDAVSQGGDHA